MRDMLLIAPHSDDVAYSLGGSILCGRLPASRSVLAVVFTVSAFAPYADDANDVETITEIRRTEDLAFARALDLEYVGLELPEAPLRLGISLDEVFKPHPLEREPAEFIELLRSRVWSCVAGPLGIGGHVDHTIIREWIRSADLPDTEKIFYEDLPYAGELDCATYEDQVARLTPGLSAETVQDSGWLGQKIALLRLYRSQVARSDLNCVRTSICRLGGERLWIA